MGEADLVLAGDLVVAACPDSLARMRPGRTRVLLNTDVAPTAAFVNNPDWRLPGSDLQAELRAAWGNENVAMLDAAELAVALLAAAIYATPSMLGYASQQGWLPLGQDALLRAIEGHGQRVPANQAAFAWGGRAAHVLPALRRLAGLDAAE